MLLGTGKEESAGNLPYGNVADRIIIVDDDAEHARVAQRILMPEGYEISSVTSAADALRMIEGSCPDLLLSDVDMPGMTGIELLGRIKHDFPDLAVVMMSGIGTVELAAQAVRAGAVDFVGKPLEVERLRVTVENALRVSRLQEENRELRGGSSFAGELVGETPPMRTLKKMIDQVAPTNGRVIILGENGTGKELIASSIHRLSPRRARPFIKVNCGALPDGLVESELFGHEKGAFTGAVARRRGRFELADKGTLLLDEVGEMPLDVQVKLLRVIQEGKFERVGGAQTLSVDVRILAATNRDLADLVSQGKFREDLYYRLNVVVLRAPPLRERREDIPLLIEHILSRRPPGQRVELTEDAVRAIAALQFPGNVRQLENVIDRLCIFNPGQLVASEQVNQIMFDAVPQTPKSAETERSMAIFQRGVSYRDRLLELERMLLVEALAEYGDNKPATAEALGTDKSFFYRKCRQFGLG